MKPLRVAHLYPEALNLYGDFGNLLALRRRARIRGLDIEYHKLGIGDAFDPGAYDFVFIGGGQDHQQSLLLKDLLEEKKPGLLEAAENGVVFLGICGGYQLLGQSFETYTGEYLEGVGCLPVVTRGEKERLIGDVVCQTSLFENEEESFLFGFENHSGQTELLPGAVPLAKVLRGHGNRSASGEEGCRKNNVFGTYLHGSFLPKNPAMTDLLLELAFRTREGEDYRLPEADSAWEKWARFREAKRLDCQVYLSLVSKPSLVSAEEEETK